MIALPTWRCAPSEKGGRPGADKGRQGTRLVCHARESDAGRQSGYAPMDLPPPSEKEVLVDLALALLLPLAGTVAGSACMFFMTGTMSPLLRRALTGFAAGVMVAASIWSLIIPAMDQSEAMGKLIGRAHV